MPFPERRNHRIQIDNAAAMTRRYRDDAKGAETAQMFPRDVIEGILGQPGALGIRFYFGREAAGGPTRLVAVAVDKEGNDLAGGEMIDYGFPCPPFCSNSNPLNS